MLKDFRDRIKVSSHVKPVAGRERTVPELICGQLYYVSFGTNWAYPCYLRSIINEFSKTEVVIAIRRKEKDSYTRKGGQLVYVPYAEHTLYAHEIGRTPEEAVKHTVLPIFL